MHTKIGTNTGQNIEVNCTLKYDGDEIFCCKNFRMVCVLYKMYYIFSPLIIKTKIAHHFLDTSPIDLRNSFA